MAQQWSKLNGLDSLNDLATDPDKTITRVGRFDVLGGPGGSMVFQERWVTWPKALLALVAIALATLLLIQVKFWVGRTI